MSGGRQYGYWMRRCSKSRSPVCCCCFSHGDPPSGFDSLQFTFYSSKITRNCCKRLAVQKDVFTRSTLCPANYMCGFRLFSSHKMFVVSQHRGLTFLGTNGCHKLPFRKKPLPIKKVFFTAFFIFDGFLL